MRIFNTIFISIFLSCASVSLWNSYTTLYVDGEKAAHIFAMDLKKKGIPYKIIPHQENIYEIQYIEPEKKSK